MNPAMYKIKTYIVFITYFSKNFAHIFPNLYTLPSQKRTRTKEFEGKRVRMVRGEGAVT